jgi:hypothetical protein
VGKIAKAALEGDHTDGPIRKARIAEQAVGAGEALIEEELREREPLPLKQLLHVARCDAMAGRQSGDIEALALQVSDNVSLHCAQTRGPDAAVRCNFCRISRRAQRKRDEITEVSDDGSSQLRGGKFPLVVQNADIAPEQHQCLGPWGYRPHE